MKLFVHARMMGGALVGAAAENPVAYGGMSGAPAGFVSRFMAFVIDLFAMAIVCVVAIQTISLTMTFFRLQSVAVVRHAATLASRGLVLVVIFSYLPLSWTLAGRSFGKAVMGISIVTERGTRMKLSRSLLRFFGYWISALPLGLGFLWPLFDRDRRAFHDVLARTRVVYGDGDIDFAVRSHAPSRSPANSAIATERDGGARP